MVLTIAQLQIRKWAITFVKICSCISCSLCCSVREGLGGQRTVAKRLRCSASHPTEVAQCRLHESVSFRLYCHTSKRR